MRNILTAAIIALALGSAAAAQNAGQNALSAPASAKVAAPAPATPTVKAGNGGGAEGPASAGNANLDAAIAAAKAKGMNTDILVKGDRDPEYQAELLTHVMYSSDLQKARTELVLTSEAFAPMQITGTLTLADGTKVPIGRSAGGQMVFQQLRPGRAVNLSGGAFRIHPDDAAITAPIDLVRDGGGQAYNVSSDSRQLTLNAGFHDQNGRIYIAPALNFPLEGGTQTIAIPGGGSLTATLGPAPPRPPLALPGGVATAQGFAPATK